MSVRVANMIPVFAGSPWQTAMLVVRGCRITAADTKPRRVSQPHVTKSTQMKGIAGEV